MGYVLSDAQRFAVGIKIVLDEDALPRGGNFTMSGLVGLVEQLTSYQADERGRHRLETMVCDMLAPQERYRRSVDKLAERLPIARWQGDTLLPSAEQVARDAATRRKARETGQYPEDVDEDGAEDGGAPPPVLPVLLPRLGPVMPPPVTPRRRGREND